MSSENKDRRSEAKPKWNDDARKYHEKSEVSYTRNFLLSVAELYACKKLPTGFNISILRELGDHSTSVLQSCHNLGTRNLQNNQFCPLLQTSEDGILGSGSFKRVSVCKTETFPLKDNGFHVLSRSSELYQPPSLSKVRHHAGTESNDQYNDETFGSPKDLSEERVERENQRRDSFILMRKKQQMTIQGNGGIFCEGMKENMNLDIALNFGKSENDEMLMKKYGKSEELEMLVAPNNLSEVCKTIQTTTAEFLPPECTPEDSTEPILISSGLTQVFVDGEKQPTHDQIDEHNFENLSSGMDELVQKFLASASAFPSATDEISGGLNGPKQAGHSSAGSIGTVLSELNVCYAILHLSMNNCKTDFSEDLESSFSDNNAASLDFVSMPLDGLGLHVEEPMRLNVDDDTKLDVSSKVRPTNFVDNPTCESMLDLRSVLETKLGPNDFDDICLPEEDDLICFDDYPICLPEEDDLISFDDYLLVPQEGQYSSPVAAKDTSSSPDASAKKQALIGACLSDRRSDHSDTEGPNSCHRYSDPASLRTPSKNMKAQQSHSSILSPQLNPVIPCFHQSFQESRESSKSMSCCSKACDSHSKSPLCFPTHLHAYAFQQPELVATRLDYTVNYLPNKADANPKYPSCLSKIWPHKKWQNGSLCKEAKPTEWLFKTINNCSTMTSNSKC